MACERRSSVSIDLIPIAMFLSLPISFHYKPCYETHEFLLSSALFYYAVFLVVLSMVVMVMIHSFRVQMDIRSRKES